MLLHCLSCCFALILNVHVVPSDGTRRACGGTVAAATATAHRSWSCTRVATIPCIGSPRCSPWRAPHVAPSTTATRCCTHTTRRPLSTLRRANTQSRRPPLLLPPLSAKPCSCSSPNSRYNSNLSSSRYSHSCRNSNRRNPARRSANAAAARHAAHPPPPRRPPPAAPQHRPSPPSLPPPRHATAPYHSRRRHHNRWPHATHLRPPTLPSPTARCRLCP